MPRFYFSLFVVLLFVSSSSVSSRTILRLQNSAGLTSASELASQPTPGSGQQYSNQGTLGAKRYQKERRLQHHLELNSHRRVLNQKMKMDLHHSQKPPAPSPASAKSTTVTDSANPHIHTDYVCANSC